MFEGRPSLNWAVIVESICVSQSFGNRFVISSQTVEAYENAFAADASQNEIIVSFLKSYRSVPSCVHVLQIWCVRADRIIELLDHVEDCKALSNLQHRFASIYGSQAYSGTARVN